MCFSLRKTPFFSCDLVVVGGGGVLNFVYSSSSSSYMDCEVFFGDECLSFRRSGVRLDQCSCIGAFVVGLIIFGIRLRFNHLQDEY